MSEKSDWLSSAYLYRARGRWSLPFGSREETCPRLYVIANTSRLHERINRARCCVRAMLHRDWLPTGALVYRDWTLPWPSVCRVRCLVGGDLFRVDKTPSVDPSTESIDEYRLLLGSYRDLANQAVPSRPTVGPVPCVTLEEGPETRWFEVRLVVGCLEEPRALALELATVARTKGQAVLRLRRALGKSQEMRILREGYGPLFMFPPVTTPATETLLSVAPGFIRAAHVISRKRLGISRADADRLVELEEQERLEDLVSALATL